MTVFGGHDQDQAKMKGKMKGKIKDNSKDKINNQKNDVADYAD